MAWNYKQDRLFTKPLWGLIGFCQFLIDLSWTYAHYRNGSFPYQFPERPRLRFKQQSFWQCVKSAWRSRPHEE